jgi:hypothetical protein
MPETIPAATRTTTAPGGVALPAPRAAADDLPGVLPGLVPPRLDGLDTYPLVRYALAHIPG